MDAPDWSPETIQHPFTETPLILTSPMDAELVSELHSRPQGPG